MLFDAGVVRGERRVPAAAAPARWPRRGSRRPRRRSSPRSRPAGARCAAARGCSPASGAMCAYAGIVLPAVYVLGPVSIAERLGGPGAWAARRRLLRPGLRAGRRAAAALPPAPRAAARPASRSSSPPARRRSTAPASGWSVTCALQFVAGIGVTAFFTLWEVSLQEHIPGEALSRVSSFDYLASTILMPVGTAVVGPLAAALGTQETLLGMSAVGIACALAFLAVPERAQPAARRGGDRRPVAFARGGWHGQRRASAASRDPRGRRRARRARGGGARPAPALRRGLPDPALGLGAGGARRPARPRRARRPGGAARRRPADARAVGHRLPRAGAPGRARRQARAAHRLRRHRGRDPGHQRGRARLLPAQAVGPARGAALPGGRGPADDVGGGRRARVRRRAPHRAPLLARDARAARLPGSQPRARALAGRRARRREPRAADGGRRGRERAAGGAARGRHGARAPDDPRAGRAPRRRRRSRPATTTTSSSSAAARRGWRPRSTAPRRACAP